MRSFRPAAPHADRAVDCIVGTSDELSKKEATSWPNQCTTASDKTMDDSSLPNIVQVPSTRSVARVRHRSNGRMAQARTSAARVDLFLDADPHGPCLPAVLIGTKPQP